MVKSQKKHSKGNFFETNFLGLKYVLKHSESIPKKNFFSKFFFENFHFLTTFVKQWLSTRKKFSRENVFEINFFGLKYVLKHSESI